MIIFGLDDNNHITYFYEDTQNKYLDKTKAFNLIKENKLVDGKKYYNHLVITRKEEQEIFYFFFDDISNKKDGKYRSKILARGISQLHVISKATEKNLNAIENIVLHNTKNIIHYLANEIKKIINYNELITQDDKIGYITSLINSNTLMFARHMLASNKSIEQISFEYNILDYLKPNVSILESDRTNVKIHSLLVQAFYIYENFFKEKNIMVNIGKDYTEIRSNFFTMRSAFALIMENCAKYCMNDSDIDIDINKDKYGNVKLDLAMMSVFNDDTELSEIFLPNIRGEEAKKKGGGNGIGLYITKRLLNLNGVEIQFKRINDTIRNYNDIKYCSNIFIIDIPSNMIFNKA